MIDAANAYMSAGNTGRWLDDGIADAKQVLVDTAETSEIERLIPWLEHWRSTTWDEKEVRILWTILDHIKSEFGGEDATDGS